MIAYALLRVMAGVALRWYYRDIQVDGLERLPSSGPMMLAVNHPNALVDALLVGWVVPRRIRITAKSTLFTNAVADRLLRWLGVVPLHRASDAAKLGTGSDPMRNRESFRAVHDALRADGTVLIFPEGKSHDEPALAPLRSGAARMALSAVQDGGVSDVAIVPIGLTFERKDAPRTRVLVQIGDPIAVAQWRAPGDEPPAQALTAEIETRLREVTLNYASVDDAERVTRWASMLAALFEEQPRVGVHRRLGAEAGLARRISAWSAGQVPTDPAMRAMANDAARRLEALHDDATAHGILIEDVPISLGARPALRFVIREGWLLLVGGPIALWGRVNHWVPFTAARSIARRSVESAADPAMRTLVAGTALVLGAYLVQGLVVGLIWGPLVAAGYLISLPVAAEVNFALSDRLTRAIRRARAFLRFRRERELQRRLADELVALRRDVVALDRGQSTLDAGAGR